MKDRSHDEAMADRFRADLSYAVELLNDVRRNGGPGEIAIILRQIEKAFGQGGEWGIVDAEPDLLMVRGKNNI